MTMDAARAPARRAGQDDHAAASGRRDDRAATSGQRGDRAATSGQRGDRAAASGARPAPGGEVAILDAMAAGNVDHAFKLLCAAYARRGYGFALRMVGDAALAEDVLQEALLQVFLGLRTLRDGASLHAWVMTVVAHRSLDEIRKRKRWYQRTAELDVLDDVADDGPTPVERLRGVEATRALALSLQSLSPKVRVAVLLRFGHACTFEEIGAAIGELPDTVRARVARALPRLRQRLQQQGLEESPPARPRCPERAQRAGDRAV